MKEFHQKTVLLIVILVGFAFIALGLTLGQFFELGGCQYDACTAGLPGF
ncbi:MAG: hypothetical protein HWN66_04935 [Candidatus Helarchaeota archaeon]|nr:hypothetical protein [Candidatus Helarchaeota archaeon]